MSKVDIIIPTKNYELIDKCLKSINKYANHDTIGKIIVGITTTDRSDMLNCCDAIFNNGHDIDSSLIPVDIVDFGEFDYFKGKFNYSKCNNYLVTFSKADYVLFMNDDVELTTDCISPCIVALDNDERVGTVGIELLYPDRSIQHGGIFAAFNRDESFKGVGHIGFKQNKMLPTIWTAGNTGAFLMMRRIDFLNVDGFDEGYDVSFQDVQLNFDVIAKLNKGCLTLNFISAIHKEKQTRD